MSAFYAFIRDTWHSLPASFRQHVAVKRIRTTFQNKVLRPLKIMSHNDVYTPHFFQKRDSAAAYAASVIAESVTNEFGPKRVVDVGCGTGELLKALQDRGCSCLGLEHASFALAICRSRGLDVRDYDITEGAQFKPIELFDVAISLEVAEHLPEQYADPYVDLVCSLSRLLVFSAAPPGQMGTDHVNEQPHEYWIQRFTQRGFTLDQALSDKWCSQWTAKDVASWYCKNIMVFRSKPVVPHPLERPSH